MTATRPFRHLCPEADKRDAMTDDEFEAYVADNLSEPYEPFDDGTEIDVAMSTTECTACGSMSACGYDAEGRPMIHTTEESESQHDC
jgi:hypothetical protein